MAENGNGKVVRLRCAVYTRKSTEEGLEQEFNSLDAQREAGEAYIASQRHQGWTLLADRYDDGGYTGANMERPALTRLLADIANGQVDVVVVYKVDRLSRSLLDFARLIEAFEKKNISFVSVTQQFNTGTSLGRLVLHILLSFAQFEREMIAERTRDKMAAARRKGKWIGGCPPIGYDVDREKRRLVVNPDEAEQVRTIFSMYPQERSLLRVVEILNGRGWRTKSWITRSGKRHEGSAWEKSALRKMLTNVTYLGKVQYKEEIHPGEHEAIIDEESFTRVGEMLGTGRRDRRGGGRNTHGFLLRGLVRCRACGSVMTSSTSAPRGKTYRYYACTDVNRRGRAECPIRSVPAQELERFIVDRIQEMGSDPSLLQDTLNAVAAERQRDVPELTREQRQLQAEHQACRVEARQLITVLATMKASDGRSITQRLAELDERSAQIELRLTEIQETLAAVDRSVIQANDVAKALSLFVPVWQVLTPREQARVLRLLVETIDYDGKTKEVAITLRPTGIAMLVREVAESALAESAA